MKKTSHSSGMRVLANLFLLGASLTIGFVALEIGSRYTIPLAPGVRNIDLNGVPISQISDHQYRLPSNLKFRQTSAEFDTTVSINRVGNRVSGTSGQPDIVFVGDSFTFGQGLSDQETFPYIYCTQTKTPCANVARSGTGTGSQVDILRHYIESEGWRPRHVKLFMLAMTRSMMSGNDLEENLWYTTASGPSSPTHVPTAGNQAVNLRRIVLANLNIARVLYFYLAPTVRAYFSPGVDAVHVSQALDATKTQLGRLDQLSLKYGFSYRIYLLHPMQDILRGTDRETFETLAKLIPNTKIVPTADLFRDNPTNYYFSYDGHFNSAGSRKIADMLLSKVEN